MGRVGKVRSWGGMEMVGVWETFILSSSTSEVDEDRMNVDTTTLTWDCVVVVDVCLGLEDVEIDSSRGDDDNTQGWKGVTLVRTGALEMKGGNGYG